MAGPIPALEDFDRVVSATVPVLDDEDVAIKIAVGCDGAEIDDESAVNVLVGHGITPDHIGGHWPSILNRAREIAATPEKLFDRVLPAVAVGLAGILVLGSPVWAADAVTSGGGPLDEFIGGILLLIIMIGSIGMALKPNRTSRRCPHREPYGDASMLGREDRR